MRLLAFALIAIGLLNWAAYLSICSRIGGDAVNGKIDGGKYYVGSHGRYVEVSQSTYEWSRLHTYLVWATHALQLAGMIILVRLHVEGNAAKRNSRDTA